MDDNANIQMKLSKLFNPTDFVRVTNPTDKPYTWRQARKEERDANGRVARQIEEYTMQPGVNKVIPADVALVYIEAMVKEVLGAEGRIQDTLQPTKVDETIKLVFVGVERSDDLLTDLKVSTIQERAGITPVDAAPPAEVNGAFDPSDIGIDTESLAVDEEESTFPDLLDDTTLTLDSAAE